MFINLRKGGEGLSKVERFYKIMLLVSYMGKLYLEKTAQDLMLTLDITGPELTDSVCNQLLQNMSGLFAMRIENITKEAVKAELEKSSWTNIFGIGVKFDEDKIMFDTLSNSSSTAPPPAGEEALQGEALNLSDALQTFNDTFPKYVDSELAGITVTEDTSDVTYVVNFPGDYPETVLLLTSLRNKLKSAKMKVIIRGIDQGTLDSYENLLNNNLNLNLTVTTADAITKTDGVNKLIEAVKTTNDKLEPKQKYLFITTPDNPEEYEKSIDKSSLSSNVTVAFVKKTKEALTTAVAQILKGYFAGKQTIVVMPELITGKDWSDDFRSTLLVLEKV